MDNNIICKSLNLLLEDIKNKRYYYNKKINILELDYLLNKIKFEITHTIKYIKCINKELNLLRSKNINLSNKLSILEIELFKKK